MKKYFAFLIFFIGLFFVPFKQTLAQQYPISELGNCKNAQECFYYCEIPYNTPSCWSYKTYVLQNKDILGDTTTTSEEKAKTKYDIAFPVKELGNCKNVEECRRYCSIADNHQACIDFGKKKGLIKQTESIVNTEKFISDAKQYLGCNSTTSCKTFCSDPANLQKCREFSQREHVTQQTSSASASLSKSLLEAAKQTLGCDSESSCLAFCTNPANYQKCKEVYQKLTQTSQAQKTTTLPCTTKDGCSMYCKTNTKQCAIAGGTEKFLERMRLYQQTLEKKSKYKSYSQTNGCATDASCRQYCQEHPDTCPGFTARATSSASATLKHPEISPTIVPKTSIDHQSGETTSHAPNDSNF